MSNLTKTRQTSRIVSEGNLYLDASNNIGIGTTVANTKLEIAGVVTAVDYNSTSDAKLKENIETVLNVIQKAKPASSKGTFMQGLAVSSTMGPGLRIDIQSYAAI